MTYDYKLEYITGTHETQRTFQSPNPINRYDVVNVGFDYFLVMAVCHTEEDSTLWLGESSQSAIEAQLLPSDNAELSEWLLTVINQRS